MKVGILVEVEEGLDWDGWRRVYVTAERLGFESVWLSDHLRSPWFGESRGLETWTALAVAAAETQRLVLGSLVSPVSFREPAIVARMANSLWRFSGGRLVAGLGMGWNTDEHRASGIPFQNPGERRQRLVATIERIRCEGEVPVLIGGRGPSVLPVVARHADEWNMTTSSASDFSRVNEQLTARCRELGRDPTEIRRSVAAGILIGRDEGELIARAERMRNCVPPLTSVDAGHELGWIVGTSRQVSQHVAELADAGVDRVILGHYDVGDDRTLELLAEALL
jgi:alkanesulfonate monooxygenase SsuD/methylene tetrahydromethanopterin reductase-like flavin-dependent oxidoreductase (luciferase family)